MSNVELVWATPDADSLVARLARVSNPENEHNDDTAPRLIRYLIRHQHWSPLEMVSMCVEIRTSRDIGRQILRHRSFSFQEFSQRYANIFALGGRVRREARLQDPNNRQNSLPDVDGSANGWFDWAQSGVWLVAKSRYEEAFARGIAKEQARALLPEGLTPSRMYMSGTLRSWVHFCRLRMGNGTQAEHADIARQCWEIVGQVAPGIHQAVNEETPQ